MIKYRSEFARVTRIRLAVGACGAALVMGAAQAADLNQPGAYKDQPFIEPSVNNWTGFYAGFSIGGEAARDKWNTASLGNGVFAVDPATSSQPGNEGFGIIGGYTGYNYQFASRFVAGIEAGIEGDFAGTRRIADFIPGSLILGPTADRVKEDLDFDGSVRARLGYLVSSKVLVYGSGGFAFQQAAYHVDCGVGANPWCDVPERGTKTELLTGWTAGGGVEAQIASHWLLRAEAYFSDYGSTSLLFFPHGSGGLDAIGSKVALQTETAKAGLTYKISPGLPGLDPNSDVSFKDAASAVAPASWAGPYVGVNFGYGLDADSSGRTFNDNGAIVIGSPPVFTIPISSIDQTPGLDRSGVFGGAHIGYNFQQSCFVYGVETDFDGSDISGKTNGLEPSFGLPFSDKGSIDYFGTIRGRLGYAYGPALIYATGGFAYGHVTETLTIPAVFSHPATLTRDNLDTGYAAGGGLEYKIEPSWSIRAEYLYVDLGKYSAFNSVVNGSGYETVSTNRINDSLHTARVGLTYHVNNIYEPLK